ncbi:MAG: hypothetical protein IKY61_02915 [Thermoguttaceae bacterium]|nr:hypothetical protein [Thermoguttaceae bacterium]
MKMKTLMLFALVASAVLVSGCGKDLGYRKTTGKVTLNGEPLAGAIVTFVGQGQGTESGAATTNDKGEYSANSGSVGEGLKPGEYKVTISKRETVVDEDLERLKAGEITDDEYQELKAKRGMKENSGSVGENLVPDEYSSAATTSLTATVTDNPKENVFNFDL